MQVMWFRLYHQGAYKDLGTLQQLQSLINRSNVPLHPKNNVHATEDFLHVSYKCHFF